MNRVSALGVSALKAAIVTGGAGISTAPQRKLEPVRSPVGTTWPRESTNRASRHDQTALPDLSIGVWCGHHAAHLSE